MKRLIIAMAVVLFVTGCSTVRAPSIEEHAYFVKLVRKRVAQDQATITPHTPFKISIRGPHATVEYGIDHATPSQTAFNPMRTKISFIAKSWRIVDHEGNRSWLQKWK